jgi:histidinol dehydrogenase
VGINLFPDRKRCSFDCPYCEVFPFERDMRFSLPLMEGALRSALAEAAAGNIPVRDICFSGNGEPTLSPWFPPALELARKLRDELAPSSDLLVISNGTGLMDRGIFDVLKRAALGDRGLHIWLKIDAGTEAWYKVMDRSGVPYGELIARIGEFAGAAPFTVQTMICRIGGLPPPAEESGAWVRLVTGLAVAAKNGPAAPPASAGLRGVQIYGKARPAPEDPLAEPAPPEVLEERAAALRQALEAAGLALPVEVFL